MCFSQPSMPKPTPPGEPLKQVDQASQTAQSEMRKRMAMAKGLESTWTRAPMAPVNGSGKAASLGGQ